MSNKTITFFSVVFPGILNLITLPIALTIVAYTLLSDHEFAVGRYLEGTDFAGLGRYNSWVDIPGVRLDARMRLAAEREKNRQSGIVGIGGEPDFGSVLTLAPLKSSYWLALAIQRARAKANPDAIYAPLRMSFLTGKYVGWLMPTRAVMGLRYWDYLERPFKLQTVSDVILSRRFGSKSVDRAFFLTLPQPEREEISAILGLGIYKGEDQLINDLKTD